MEDLIKALQIFMQYGNPEHPFHCEHDTLYFCGVDPGEVSDEDKKKLDDLGFFVGSEGDGFMSFKYGSC